MPPFCLGRPLPLYTNVWFSDFQVLSSSYKNVIKVIFCEPESEPELVRQECRSLHETHWLHAGSAEMHIFGVSENLWMETNVWNCLYYILFTAAHILQTLWMHTHTQKDEEDTKLKPHMFGRGSFVTVFFLIWFLFFVFLSTEPPVASMLLLWIQSCIVYTIQERWGLIHSMVLVLPVWLLMLSCQLSSKIIIKYEKFSLVDFNYPANHWTWFQTFLCKKTNDKATKIYMWYSAHCSLLFQEWGWKFPRRIFS